MLLSLFAFLCTFAAGVVFETAEQVSDDECVICTEDVPECLFGCQKCIISTQSCKLCSAATCITAPDVFRVSFITTFDDSDQQAYYTGQFIMEVHTAWAPLGAQRFYELISAEYYEDTIFYRVVPDFVVQWGFPYDPEWHETLPFNVSIPDDPVLQSNVRGMVSFATQGPDTRTTHVFINYANNSHLDDMGFAPFAKIVEGMDDVVDKIHIPSMEFEELYNGLDEYGSVFALDNNVTATAMVVKEVPVPCDGACGSNTICVEGVCVANCASDICCSAFQMCPVGAFTECVCAFDPYCCEIFGEWDDQCIQEAQDRCGMQC